MGASPGPSAAPAEVRDVALRALLVDAPLPCELRGDGVVAKTIVPRAPAGREKRSRTATAGRSRLGDCERLENAACARSLEPEPIIGKRSRVSDGLPSGACWPALFRLTPGGVGFCNRRGAAVWPAPARRLLRLLKARRLDRHVARARSRGRAAAGAACWGSSLQRASKHLPADGPFATLHQSERRGPDRQRGSSCPEAAGRDGSVSVDVVAASHQNRQSGRRRRHCCSYACWRREPGKLARLASLQSMHVTLGRGGLAPPG